MGYTRRSQLALKVAHKYYVYGMNSFRGVIMTLVVDETDLPNWYPIELFEVVDPAIPDDWFFRRVEGSTNGLEAIWGYKDLVLTPGHYDQLINRDPQALEVIRRLRALVDRK
jgi:hypothetical protein